MPSTTGATKIQAISSSCRRNPDSVARWWETTWTSSLRADHQMRPGLLLEALPRLTELLVHRLRGLLESGHDVCSVEPGLLQDWPVRVLDLRTIIVGIGDLRTVSLHCLQSDGAMIRRFLIEPVLSD